MAPKDVGSVPLDAHHKFSLFLRYFYNVIWVSEGLPILDWDLWFYFENELLVNSIDDLAGGVPAPMSETPYDLVRNVIREP